MSWTTVRNEIETQLQAVTGIGKVYAIRRNPTSEADFQSAFKSGSKINAIQFWLSSADEFPDGTGSEDEERQLQHSRRIESWTFELFFGFDDTGNKDTSSEKFFQELVEAIEAKFRFLQDLNGKVEHSAPLDLITAGLFEMLSGLVLIHRAEFRLELELRIQNPAAE